jgi:hypothetical protein
MQQVLRTKRPLDRLDYDVDFSRWLPLGDSIASIAVTVTPATGGTLAADGSDFTATAVKVWVKDGINGETGHVEVKVTTIQARTKDVCFSVRVREGC